MPHVCFYVTSHGFGHAARVQAVLEALLADPGWTAEVRTGAPRALFEWLLGDRASLTRVELEPGVVQIDSVRHDVPATLRAWEDHLRRLPALLEAEAAHLLESGASLVVSDASPAGCAAASRAGLPALLLGNFTWDWILEEYVEELPAFRAVIEEVRRLYRGAGRYLRLPMSAPWDLGVPEEALPLLARRPRRPRAEVRDELGVSPGERLVLLSFGGYGLRELDLDRVAARPGVRCLTDRGASRAPELLSVEGRGLHYPDLIGAADLVLCKPGYGIFSEAIAAGTRIAYVPRSGFREAPVLERWLRDRWPCVRLDPASLADGSWVDAAIAFLAAAPMPPLIPVDGAARVVELLGQLGPGQPEVLRDRLPKPSKASR